jgi:hypothetical protein
MAHSVGRTSKLLDRSRTLHRDLAAYAVAASAAGVSTIALAPPAEAEVVYTPVHQVIKSNQNYVIDLNHDGIGDFTIQNLVLADCSQRGFTYYCPAFRLQAVPAVGGAIQTGAHSFYAAALLPGSEIGPTKRARPRPGIMAAQFQTYGTFLNFGSWQNVSNGYLGFHFKIDGEMHYGWARLSVQSTGKYRLVAELMGFAYETEPNLRIIAGDEGSDNAESATEVEISAPPSEVRPATLGALALGAKGLPTRRRPI